MGYERRLHGEISGKHPILSFRGDAERARLESVISEVEIAEEFKTWDDYKAWLGEKNITWGRSEKDLEYGQELLKKGIDSKKLGQIITILEKCKETE